MSSSFERPKPCRAGEIYGHILYEHREFLETKKPDEIVELMAIVGGRMFTVRTIGYMESDFIHITGTLEGNDFFKITAPVEQVSFVTVISKLTEEKPQVQIGFAGALKQTD